MRAVQVRNMDHPKYILKTGEAVLMPQNQDSGMTCLENGSLLCGGIGSLIFQDNLFFEMTWTTRGVLIAAAIGVMFTGSKKENVPSPIVLQFYEDYMFLYRPKVIL